MFIKILTIKSFNDINSQFILHCNATEKKTYLYTVRMLRLNQFYHLITSDYVWVTLAFPVK